jgi:hypothetical protein
MEFFCVSSDLDEAIKKTTRCCNDFSCLATGECGNLPQCKIEKCYDENMLDVTAVRDTEGFSCPYKFSIGSNIEHICTCPTHYAIYKRNKR